jgi:hypothetical protein
MTRPHLRPCPGCARHVRVSEVACPFCGGALGAELRASPAPVAPAGRLSRAALFAVGTGAAVLGSVGAVECTRYTSAIAPPYGAVAFDPTPFGQHGDAGTDGATADAADAGETD